MVVTHNLVLLVASIVLFVICALAGFDVFNLSHFWGWGFAGFTCFAAAHLP